jgi:hypothetical protein
VPVPIVVVYAGSAAASVAFEYGYHRIKGDRASTKELVIAGALGSIPLGKAKMLSKAGVKAVGHSRRLAKTFGIGLRDQARGAIRTFGRMDESAKHLAATVPGFGLKLTSYHVKSNLAHAGLGRAYDRMFPRRTSMRMKTYS